MKKLLSIFISLVFLFGITTVGISVKAADYTYEDWCYSLTNSTQAILTNYTGNSKNITLPGKVGKYTVIGTSANFLRGNDSIVSVTIPEGYKIIGNYAFSKCERLVSVSIPRSMEEIGNITSASCGCFSECPELESVSFATGGTKEAKIGSYSFSECPKLISIVIPGNYKEIGYCAFSDCLGLQKLSIIKGIDNRELGAYAFRNCDVLLKVDIPEGFVKRGNYAFSKCESLVSVSIPRSIEEIGNITSASCGCFSECPELESVSFATGGTKEAKIGSYSFSECHKIISVIIPSNYIEIGYRVFSNCDSLESIIISENQYSSKERIVSGEAFFGNNNLKSIHIPVGVSQIGKNSLCDTHYSAIANLIICSTSTNCVAKQFADKNGYKFVVCDGKHAYENETTFTLTYNANGGSGAPAKQSGERSYTISSIMPTRNGYTFLGWAKNSQALSASYVVGDKINLSADLTLYAVWSKDAIGGEEEKDSVSVKANDLLLNYKENSKISVEVTGTDNYMIVYESSNPEIVSVNKDGNVTALGTGTAEITVTVTDENGNVVEDICTVTVNMAWWQWIIYIVFFGWIWY